MIYYEPEDYNMNLDHHEISNLILQEVHYIVTLYVVLLNMLNREHNM